MCWVNSAIKQISKDSSKRISKKDRKEQRAEFRVIEDFVVSCAFYECVCEFFVIHCNSPVSSLQTIAYYSEVLTGLSTYTVER